MSDTLREAIKAAIQDAWDEKSHASWGDFKNDAAKRVLVLFKHGVKPEEPHVPLSSHRRRETDDLYLGWGIGDKG